MGRGLRLFGHPVHAMLVHAPMGLLSTAPLWDVLGAVTDEPTFFAVAAWTVGLGVASGLVAAAAGFLDFAALEEGSPAEPVAVRHMIFVLAALGLFGSSLVLRHGPTPVSAWGALACDAVGLLALGVGGYHGGELVHGHGVGRRDGARG